MLTLVFLIYLLSLFALSFFRYPFRIPYFSTLCSNLIYLLLNLPSKFYQNHHITSPSQLHTFFFNLMSPVGASTMSMGIGPSAGAWASNQRLKPEVVEGWWETVFLDVTGLFHVWACRGSRAGAVE